MTYPNKIRLFLFIFLHKLFGKLIIYSYLCYVKQLNKFIMVLVILGEMNFIEGVIDYAVINKITGVAQFPTFEQASEFGEDSLETAESYLIPSVYSERGIISFNCDVTLIENILGKKLWVYDVDNARVVTTDDTHVFYCDNLECPEVVIETVVSLYNFTQNNDYIGSNGILDLYLLDEGLCTQEDREEIVEQIYDFLNA